MEKPDKQEESKNQLTYIKTFPVPLRENQGNLTINTNAPSKPSQEQIINQATSA